MLRRIFGFKSEEVTREWREKLHNEELNDLYCSLIIVRWIKSRRLRRAGHVACMGLRRGAYRVLVGNIRERHQLEDPGVDGRIILTWIYRKCVGRAWTGSSWLRIGTGGGHL